MSINITTVFNILKQQVKNGKANVLTYSELSQAYYDCTGVYHEPHGSWDAALGKKLIIGFTQKKHLQFLQLLF